MNVLRLTKINTSRGYAEDAPTAPVAIAPDSIRCFYPRKHGAPGTRITFRDGGGFCVAEAYDDVLAYLESGVVPAVPNLTQLEAPAHEERDPEDDEGSFHA